jgi:hypothetical protein
VCCITVFHVHRRSEKPFLFVWNMIVPGPPTICCVFVFGADSHPDALGSPPDDPEDSDWQPFDFLMWRWGVDWFGLLVELCVSICCVWYVLGSPPDDPEDSDWKPF